MAPIEVFKFDLVHSSALGAKILDQQLLPSMVIIPPRLGEEGQNSWHNVSTFMVFTLLCYWISNLFFCSRNARDWCLAPCVYTVFTVI